MRNTLDGSEIIELSCNLDDMTPEKIGFAQDILLREGARDVYTTPLGMKKSRPGVLFTCICLPEDAERMARLIFLHTTTLGVREKVCKKRALACTARTIQTQYGGIRIKEAEGYGVTKHKCEYEDAARAAREHNVTLEEIYAQVERALLRESEN